MRLTQEQAKKNRQTILEAASRMFRLRGIERVSVTDIMKESGFTHGGFYNHFESKEQLTREAVACAFETTTASLAKRLTSIEDPQKAIDAVIADYLSPAYRDSTTGGCPASALSADAAREGREVQTSFAEGVKSYLELFAERIGGNRQEARERAIALLCGLVGGLALSRSVKKINPKLSDELLAAARKQFCKQSFGASGKA
jgi:TetR/AcrR family transcriptional repressor of nem operon